MKELFSLGELFVSDFVEPGSVPRAGRAEMKMMFDEETNEVRLEKVVDPHFMYGKYWYRSGTNATMNRELKNVVDSIVPHLKVGEEPVWLDIACNDGTLLKHVPNNFRRIGIDPVDDTFKVEAEQHGEIVQDFFSKEAYASTGAAKADVVTCIAMFYDLDDPDVFLQDLYEIMSDNGVFVCQMSYTPLMLNQLAFDNICHEHVFYYTFETFAARLRKNGFQVIDCQLNDVNGGSFRVFAMKDIADTTRFGSQPFRDVGAFRCRSLSSKEREWGYNTTKVWDSFYERLLALKTATYDFIVKANERGEKVWGYGASTKGNTLLQYFGLDHTLIEGIAERSEYKFGLETVGTNIPIYSEDEMRKANPDYLLVLPWHFINEFVEREADYLNSGGRFIVPCPKFEVIGGK